MRQFQRRVSVRRRTTVDPNVKNLLYDHPEYYEVLYPELHDETPNMCRRIFDRYLSEIPRSILDIGCGTGRDLRSLRKTCPDCVGMDYLPQMIEYARSRSSSVTYFVGDMRTWRHDRTFDVVLCFGSVILYAISDQDVDQTLETFVAHSHHGSLLIIDMRNASAYLGRDFDASIEGDVASPEFTAHYTEEYSLNRRRQLLCRKRTWEISDGTRAQDYCEYRLFLPHEIEYRLRKKGFTVLGMYDNKELHESDLSGSTLYVVAEYEENIGKRGT